MDYINNLKKIGQNYVSTGRDVPVMFANKDNTFANAMAKAKLLVGSANDIYYGAKDENGNPADPRSEAYKDLLADSFAELYKSNNRDYFKANYKTIMKSATGYDLDASSAWDVFTNKVGEGLHNNFTVAIPAFAEMLDYTFGGHTDAEKELLEKSIDKRLQEGLKYRRTDYFKEFDGLMNDLLTSTASFLPSVLPSVGIHIAGAALSGLTGGLSSAVAIGASSIWSAISEASNLALELRQQGANIGVITGFASAYGVVAGIIEAKAGDIMQNKVLSGLKNAGILHSSTIKMFDNNFVASTAREAIARAGGAYALSFLTEPTEEMLQDFFSSLFTNMANSYQSKYGKAFTDNKSLQEMIDSAVAVGKETFTGNILLGLTQNVLSFGASEVYGELAQIRNARKKAGLEKGQSIGEKDEIVLTPQFIVDKDTEPAKADKNGVIGKFKAYKTATNDIIPATKDDIAKAKAYWNDAGYKKDNTVKTRGAYAEILENVSSEGVDNMEESETALHATRAGLDEVNARIEGNNIYVPKDSFRGVVARLMSLEGMEFNGLISSDENSISLNMNDKVLNIKAEDSTKGNELDYFYEKLPEQMKQQYAKHKEELLAKEDLKAGYEPALNKAIEASKAEFKESNKTYSTTLNTNIYNALTKGGMDSKRAQSISNGSVVVATRLANALGISLEDFLGDYEITDELRKYNKKGGYKNKPIEYKDSKGKKHVIYGHVDFANHILSLTKNSDATTVVHEIGHIFLGRVGDFNSISGFKDNYIDSLVEDNTKDGVLADEKDWVIGDKTQEAFAEDFERYIRTGEAKDSTLKKIFEQLKKAIFAIRAHLNTELSDSKRKMFDELLGEEAVVDELAENDGLYSNAELKEDVGGADISKFKKNDNGTLELNSEDVVYENQVYDGRYVLSKYKETWRGGVKVYEKFSNDKIGSSAGTYYSWGGYVSEAKGVADSYARHALSNNGTNYIAIRNIANKILNIISLSKVGLKESIDFIVTNGMSADAYDNFLESLSKKTGQSSEELENNIASKVGYFDEVVNKYKEEAELLVQDVTFDYFEDLIYETKDSIIDIFGDEVSIEDIADYAKDVLEKYTESPKRVLTKWALPQGIYFDWDSKLKLSEEEANSILKFIDEYRKSYSIPEDEDIFGDFELYIDMEDVEKSLISESTFGELYNKLVSLGISAKDLSLGLWNLGYKGVVVPIGRNHGRHNAKEDENYNFVIWNPEEDLEFVSSYRYDTTEEIEGFNSEDIIDIILEKDEMYKNTVAIADIIRTGNYNPEKYEKFTYNKDLIGVRATNFNDIIRNTNNDGLYIPIPSVAVTQVNNIRNISAFFSRSETENPPVLIFTKKDYIEEMIAKRMLHSDDISSPTIYDISKDFPEANIADYGEIAFSNENKARYGAGFGSGSADTITSLKHIHSALFGFRDFDIDGMPIPVDRNMKLDADIGEVLEELFFEFSGDEEDFDDGITLESVFADEFENLYRQWIIEEYNINGDGLYSLNSEMLNTNRVNGISESEKEAKLFDVRQMLENILNNEPSDSLVNMVFNLYERPVYNTGDYGESFARWPLVKKDAHVLAVPNYVDDSKVNELEEKTGVEVKKIDFSAFSLISENGRVATEEVKRIAGSELFSEDIVDDVNEYYLEILDNGGFLLGTSKNLVDGEVKINSEMAKKWELSENTTAEDILNLEDNIIKLFRTNPDLMSMAKVAIQEANHNKTAEQYDINDWKKAVSLWQKGLEENDAEINNSSVLPWMMKRINDYFASNNAESDRQAWINKFRGTRGVTFLNKFARDLADKSGIFSEGALNKGKTVNGERYYNLALLAYRLKHNMKTSDSLRQKALDEILSDVPTFRNLWLRINGMSDKATLEASRDVANEAITPEYNKAAINQLMYDRDLTAEEKKMFRDEELSVNTINRMLDELDSKKADISRLNVEINNLRTQLNQSGVENALLQSEIKNLENQRRAAYKEIAKTEKRLALEEIKRQIDADKIKLRNIATKKAGDARTAFALKTVFNVISSRHAVANIYNDNFTETLFKDNAPLTYQFFINNNLIDTNGNLKSSLAKIAKPEYEPAIDSYTKKMLDGLISVMQKDSNRSATKLKQKEQDFDYKNTAVTNKISSELKGFGMTNEDKVRAQEQLDKIRAEKILKETDDKTMTFDEALDIAEQTRNLETDEERELAEQYVFNHKINIARGSETQRKKNRGAKAKASWAWNWTTNPSTLFKQMGDTMYDFFFGKKDAKGNDVYYGLNQFETNYFRESDKRVNRLSEKVASILGISDSDNRSRAKKINDVFVNMSSKKYGAIAELSKSETRKAINTLLDKSQVAQAKNLMNKNFFVKNTAEYTNEQLMTIYVMTHNNDGLTHIVTSDNGISIAQAMAVRKMFDEAVDGSDIKLMKDIADAVMVEIGSKFQEVSDVALNVDNVILKFEPNYWPLISSDHRVQFNMALEAYQKKAVLTSFFLIDRLSGNTPVNLNMLHEYENIIISQERYIAGAEMFKRFNDVLNGDNNLLGKIESAYNKQTADMVKNFIAINQNRMRGDLDEVNTMIGHLRSNLAAAKMLFNFSSVLQQPSSLFLGFSKYGAKKMLGAMTRVISGGREYIENNVYAYSPQMRRRNQYEIGMAQAVKAGDGKLSRVQSWMASKGLWLMEKTDHIFAAILFDVAFQDNLNNGMSIKSAEMDATQWVMDIQSNISPKNNPLIYSSSNDVVKTLLLFTNQLNKQYNIVVRAIAEGGLKNIFMASTAVLLSVAYVSFATGKFLPTNPDDDAWEKWLKAVEAETLGMIPIIGSTAKGIVEGATYGASNVVGVDSVLKLMQFGNALLEEDKGKKAQKVGTATKNLVTAVEDLFAMPSVATKRLFQGSELYINGGGLMGLIAPQFGTEYRKYWESK